MKSKRVKKQALRVGNPLQTVCNINSDTSRVEPIRNPIHMHILTDTNTVTHTRRAAVTMLGH